jgi:hypothetical protein
LGIQVSDRPQEFRFGGWVHVLGFGSRVGGRVWGLVYKNPGSCPEPQGRRGCGQVPGSWRVRSIGVSPEDPRATEGQELALQ